MQKINNEVKKILEKYFGTMNQEVYQDEIELCSSELSEYILALTSSIEDQYIQEQLELINKLQNILEKYK